MIDKAKKLTKDLNGDGKTDQYGLGVEASIIRLAPFIWSNGGQIVDDDENPTRLTLDDARGSGRARGVLRSCTSVDGVIPGDEELESEDDETRFQNGRVAMILSIPALDADVPHDQELRLGRRPAAEAQEAGRHPPLGRLLHGQGVEGEERGLEFMEYAVGPKGAPVIARTGRTVPSLKSVAESKAFLDPNAKPRELEGLPRHDPGDPGTAEHLHVA